MYHEFSGFQDDRDDPHFGAARGVNNKPIPFTVSGTCSEPVFHPDIAAVVKDEMEGVGRGVGKGAASVVKGLLGGKKKN
jgi:hypothetical protein